MARKKLTTAEHRRRNLKYVWGLTVEEYDELLVLQDGVCAICKRTCDAHLNLAIDHCHSSNKFRGLLCYRCNIALGLVDDSMVTLENMVTYLESHT